MCCAVAVRHGRSALCRNFDLEYGIERELIRIKAGDVMELPLLGRVVCKYSIVGMGIRRPDLPFPLLFDGVNGAGLASVGLNFAGCAYYTPTRVEGKTIPSFALMPYSLALFSSVKEVYSFLSDKSLCDLSASPDIPPSPLHFMLADSESTLCVEPLEEGLTLSLDKSQVLTNAPSLDCQLSLLNGRAASVRKLAKDKGRPVARHPSLSAAIMPSDTDLLFESTAKTPFTPLNGSEKTAHTPYSSEARFQRCARILTAATAKDAPLAEAPDMLRILSAASIPYGLEPKGESYLYTRYSSVMLLDRPEYLLLDYEAPRLERHLL